MGPNALDTDPKGSKSLNWSEEDPGPNLYQEDSVPVTVPSWVQVPRPIESGLDLGRKSSGFIHRCPSYTFIWAHLMNGFHEWDPLNSGLGAHHTLHRPTISNFKSFGGIHTRKGHPVLCRCTQKLHVRQCTMVHAWDTRVKRCAL